MLARFSRGNRLITIRPSVAPIETIDHWSGPGNNLWPFVFRCVKEPVINHPSNYLNRVVRIKFRRGLIRRKAFARLWRNKWKIAMKRGLPLLPLLLLARSFLIDRPASREDHLARLDAPRRRNVSHCVRWPVLRWLMRLPLSSSSVYREHASLLLVFASRGFAGALRNLEKLSPVVANRVVTKSGKLLREKARNLLLRFGGWKAWKKKTVQREKIMGKNVWSRSPWRRIGKLAIRALIGRAITGRLSRYMAQQEKPRGKSGLKRKGGEGGIWPLGNLNKLNPSGGS